MIYVRLAGGLGNQLFQLACALKVRTGREPILLATNALDHYKTARAPEVAQILDLSKLDVQLGYLSNPLLKALMAFRLPRIFSFFGVGDNSFIAKSRQSAVDSSRRCLFVDGYFQTQWDWTALSGCLQDIVAAMSLPAAPQDAEACAIHVRGTDFLLSETHRLISSDYYQRAISLLVESQRISSIRVVTDDLLYARSIIEPLRLSSPTLECHYTREATNVVEDFNTLRNANFRIIPNSTFSWWAAASDPRRGLTIAPSRFVRHAQRHPVLPWERTISPNIDQAPVASMA